MAQQLTNEVVGVSATLPETVCADFNNCLLQQWGPRVALILAGAVLGMGYWHHDGAPTHSLPICFSHSLIFSASIGGLLLFAFSICGAAIARRPFPLNWVLLILVILISSAAGTMLGGALVIGLEQHPIGDYSALTAHSLRTSLLLSLVFGICFYLYENLKKELEAMTLRLRNKQLEEERARKLAIAAQLASLESRVRPHFLFNTLNSIAALIRENPERAEQMVGHLSALLRFSLDAREERTVRLGDEVKLVNDYLEIEKARFGPRLRFRVDVPAELSAVAVPPFALQTLVENSVKHAIARSRAGGEIGVYARGENAHVRLEVRDDGPGFSAEAIRAGHGLDTLQSRLAALFSGQGSLEIQADGRQTAVAITLPR